MAYSGTYKPKNPDKYQGDPTNIKYRSLWERSCMKVFDSNPSFLKWASEELAIKYMSPVDNKVHRYYPDFAVLMKQKDGSTKKLLIEVKPAKQTIPPKLPKSGRRTQAYKNAYDKWLVNDAKWKAARNWCEHFGYEFQIITEHTAT